jgi:hypothetical protein
MAEAWRRWQDSATAVVGVLLFITPFVFGATGTRAAAWNAYVAGVLLVICWGVELRDAVRSMDRMG